MTAVQFRAPERPRPRLRKPSASSQRSQTTCPSGRRGRGSRIRRSTLRASIALGKREPRLPIGWSDHPPVRPSGRSDPGRGRRYQCSTNAGRSALANPKEEFHHDGSFQRLGRRPVRPLQESLKNDKGQTFVEYALVLSVIVVGVLLAATWTGLGTAIARRHRQGHERQQLHVGMHATVGASPAAEALTGLHSK